MYHQEKKKKEEEKKKNEKKEKKEKNEKKEEEEEKKEKNEKKEEKKKKKKSSSLEANSFSASRKTPRILWNPQVHHSVKKKLSTFPSAVTYFLIQCRHSYPIFLRSIWKSSS